MLLLETVNLAGTIPYMREALPILLWLSGRHHRQSTESGGRPGHLGKRPGGGIDGVGRNATATVGIRHIGELARRVHGYGLRIVFRNSRDEGRPSDLGESPCGGTDGVGRKAIIVNKT